MEGDQTWRVTSLLHSTDITHLPTCRSLTPDLTGDHVLSRSDEEVTISPQNPNIPHLKLPATAQCCFCYSSFSVLSLVVETEENGVLEVYREGKFAWERVVETSLDPFLLEKEEVVPHSQDGGNYLAQGTYGVFAVRTTERFLIFSLLSGVGAVVGLVCHIPLLPNDAIMVAMALTPSFCVLAQGDAATLQLFELPSGKAVQITRRAPTVDPITSIVAITPRKFVIATSGTAIMLLATSHPQTDAKVLSVLNHSLGSSPLCGIALATRFVEPFCTSMDELCAVATANNTVALGHIRKGGLIPLHRIDVSQGASVDQIAFDVHQYLPMLSPVRFLYISQSGEFLHVVTTTQRLRYKLGK